VTTQDLKATAPSDISSTVAIHAPRGRDAVVAGQLLSKEDIASIPVQSLSELASLVQSQIGAVLITEEALVGQGAATLTASIAAQPAWSDVPFIVLANGTANNRSEDAKERMDALRNAVLMSRPLHAEELIRSVRSALKARARQHDARKSLEQLQLRERELFDSQAKFHAISDTVDQMIWSTTPDGYHDYFNHRWYEFTGVPDGSTDGEAWNGIFHPDDQERAWETWRHSLRTGEPYEIEYRLRHKSGAYRWVLGRARAALDETGSIMRWYGSCTDIHEIKQAEEQRRLMLAEMNHRVKNTLTMVNVMISQSLRQSANIQDAQASIQARIAMMARAHDRLINANWSNTRIVEVINAALVPHRTGEGRFVIEGADHPISSKQALALTMALHELATNAAKYGALSSGTGKVLVKWGAKTDDSGQFSFVWAERGGPTVQPPTRRGFGSLMIEQALAGYFRGSAELIYDPAGLTFSLSAPLTGLTD
jgi:PAS domain S-box-containing protein